MLRITGCAAVSLADGIEESKVTADQVVPVNERTRAERMTDMRGQRTRLAS